MSDCPDITRNNCGRIQSSNCVSYEGTFHLATSIDPCDEPSLTSVIQDINTELDALNAAIDLTGLGSTCLTYTIPTAGSLTVSIVLAALEEKICELTTLVEQVDSSDCPLVYSQTIACVGLDLGNLADACGTTPSTLAELLQVIINNSQNA